MTDGATSALAGFQIEAGKLNVDCSFISCAFFFCLSLFITLTFSMNFFFFLIMKNEKLPSPLSPLYGTNSLKYFVNVDCHIYLCLEEIK